MANIADALEKDLENRKIRLTFDQLSLQWWTNKQESDSDMDYSIRINFLKLKSKDKDNGSKSNNKNN